MKPGSRFGPQPPRGGAADLASSTAAEDTTPGAVKTPNNRLFSQTTSFMSPAALRQAAAQGGQDRARSVAVAAPERESKAASFASDEGNEAVRLSSCGLCGLLRPLCKLLCSA